MLFGQTKRIVLLDVVEVQNGNVDEALFYYGNNWLPYRKAMLAKGFLQSYKMMKVLPDSSQKFQLILETVYSDSMQFALSEPRWEQIFKEVNPGGTKLLNHKKAADFRTVILSRKSEILSEEKIAKKEL